MKSRWRAPSPADSIRCPADAVFAAGERNHHISNTAYPIAHESSWAPYRVTRDQHEGVVRRAFDDVDDICLYVHIPFCETRCSICEYTVVSGDDLDNTAGYRDSLLNEIKRIGALLRAAGKTHRVRGIDIGGGTPSFVPAADIAAIVAALHTEFDCGPEAGISIETTPKIAAAEPAKLKAWINLGIERFSMGVQVIQPDLLQVLARNENGVEHHHRAVDNIRSAGCARLNLDVMYGFADQSPESLAATLHHCIALGPEYVTLYRMRYKLTRISHQAPRVTLEHAKTHAALARSILQDAGYEASPGKNTFTHRRVNQGRSAGSSIELDVGTSAYLTRRVIEGMPYVGLGLGAQTFTHTTISYNDGSVGKNLLPYLRSVAAGRLPLQDLYDLPQTQMMAKFVAVAFYFGEIDRVAFERKFDIDIDVAFAAEVEFVKERGLMQETTGQMGNSRALSLTPEGACHFAGVIALFFAPSVQKYLIDRDPEHATDMNVSRAKALRIAG